MLRFVPVLALTWALWNLGSSHAVEAAKTTQKQTSSTSAKKSTTASKTKTTKSSSTTSKKTSSKSGKKGSTQSSKKKARKPRGQQSMEASRVVEIQNALAAAGYYKSSPSGQWDDETSKALSTYQQENGFKVTGKPDALSLKKLGL
ncbi:MAG: peptidoglycan-binding domain-containing protein [Terriglobia bacterium]